MSRTIPSLIFVVSLSFLIAAAVFACGSPGTPEPTATPNLALTAEKENMIWLTAETRQERLKATSVAREATATERAVEVVATRSAKATFLAENSPTPKPPRPTPTPVASIVYKGIRFQCERLRMAYRQMSSLGSDYAYMHVGNTMTLNSGNALAYFDGYDAKTALNACGR